MKHVTGIVGGIGAGKSVVRRIVSAMGYPVYDCDSRAKSIMDSDPAIHTELCAHIHPHAVANGVINRPLISEIVFADKTRLAALNSIVHTHVTADLLAWIDQPPGARCFVETAIPKSSALDKILTDAWIITAADDVRISRVIERSHLSADQIRSRIASQMSETQGLECTAFTIYNDPESSLLSQINSLI